MHALERHELKLILRLIRAVRQIRNILPGEPLPLGSGSAAVYIGAVESGDIQTDYLQLHTFRLPSGVRVVLAAPSLNRKLSRLLL